MFFDDSLVLELFIFLGFSMSWIGGFVGLLIGGVVLFWKVFLSWLEFFSGLFLIWLVWVCELLTILGLFGFLSWFEFALRLSGLVRGFVNKGFLFKLFVRGLPFTAEITGDLSSLFCL